MQRFTDKVALITGAASGIGQAAAQRLASEGAGVMCADLNSDALDAVVTQINSSAGNAQACAFDISNEGQVNECVQQTVDYFGKLDIVINMAGILKFDTTHSMEFSAWQKLIDVNLSGTFLLCKAVLPYLLLSKGNIVNAASTASLTGLPSGAAYSATKGGVLAMTRSIAVEYAKRGVRANCVCPGDINTGMTANLSMPEDFDYDLLTRIQSLSGAKGPEVVAGVIAMLASEDGAHINGEDIRVDGGMLS
jgi:NAD(P)-dependent dehydrogenase (short-subunit alcohol dehydrogenase family)